MIPIIQDISIAAGLLLLLLVALEAGFRIGRRATGGADASLSSQVGAIQGALLGLLGLLLAFSFAAAGARFLERQDLIVQEANAIGTAYLRADLLDEPHRSELRAALRRYTENRIEISAGSAQVRSLPTARKSSASTPKSGARPVQGSRPGQPRCCRSSRPSTRSSTYTQPAWPLHGSAFPGS